MTEEISRAAAKELIERTDFGFVIVGDMDVVPVLGELEDEAPRVEITVEAYKYGAFNA